MTKTLKERADATTNVIEYYDSLEESEKVAYMGDMVQAAYILQRIVADQQARIEELEEKVTHLTKVIKQQKATNDRIRRLESQEVTEAEVEAAEHAMKEIFCNDPIVYPVPDCTATEAKAALEAARKARLER